jgi:hypothetical protein
MSLDPAILNREQTPFRVQVERGRLRQFVRAIGETDPVYFDLDAAHAADHRDLLVPPTFLFGLELEQSDTFEVLTEFGVELSRVLHGEQTFRYRAAVYAGDELEFRSSFVETYAKAGGALEFLIRRTIVTRDSQTVAELESVTVIRTGAAA